MVAYTPGARLWVRDLSRLKPREIPDIQGAEAPFWSPNSEWVAYAASGILRKVPALGGPSQTICDLPRQGNFLGGTWGTAGSIVFGISSSGLFEVPAQGGEIKPFLMADRSKGELDFHSPHFLPERRAVVYTLHPTSGNQFRLFVRSGQVTRPVLDDSAGNILNAFYSASGHLLYERIRGGRAIYAVPFSLASLSASGQPFQVAEDGANPSVAEDGTLMYQSAPPPAELVMLDRNGKLERVASPAYEGIRYPAFSPDGSRIALMGVEEGNHYIWIHDLARGSNTRLTVERQVHTDPAWSPSGEQIAYAKAASGKTAIFGKRSDGSGDALPLVPGDSSASAPEWSPDGKYLVYLKPAPKGGNDIWYLPLTGNGGPTPFLETPFGEAGPRVSPDGRHIAYSSNESGRLEVYVKPFPQGQGRWLVSVNGGTLPRWSRGGNELVYLEGNAVMAVPLQTKPSFRAGGPEKLFDGNQAGVGLFSFTPTISAYDVTADGRHFVAVRRRGGAGSYLTIVQNWLGDFQHLK
jgi:serine/threonine-protein kinase